MLRTADVSSHFNFAQLWSFVRNTKMHEDQDEVKSLLKIAQFWHFVKNAHSITRQDDSHKAIIDNILNDDFNVNHRFTMSHMHQKYRMEDCTALHSAFFVRDIVAFDSLLKRGADFTMKNGKGQTVLHLAIDSLSMDNYDSVYLVKPFINSILSAHVEYHNFANPQNDNGISHLHGACVMNHVDSLRIFLGNSAWVNQAVNSQAENYSGFTPLHFSALFDSFEVAEVLVSQGADVNAKNARGLTPLDVCLEHKVNMLRTEGFRERQTYENQLNNDKIVELLLNFQRVPSAALSKLHVASTLNNLSIVENLLRQNVNIDYAVPDESPIFPGYTAAHFAAFNCLDAVKMLIIHGGRLDTVGVDGLTPFDICINNYNIQDVYDILDSAENWKSMDLSGNRTTLLDFLQASMSLDQFELFLKNATEDVIVPSNCSLWQSYTILHFAVTLSENIYRIRRYYQSMSNENRCIKNLVEQCLKVTRNVNVQNSRGETAIHLAFKQKKNNLLEPLLKLLNGQEEVTNLIDEDHLSYLHIACAEKNESLVEKLLRTSKTNMVYKGKQTFPMFSLVPGSTPLHIAASVGASTIAKMLLRHGADLHAVDSNGMRPIHCLIKCYRSQDLSVLFHALLDDPKDCVVDEIGLSYLHIACLFNDLKVVGKLLEFGARVNAVITSNKQFLPKSQQYHLQQYLTFTPLHMAQLEPDDQLIDLLILHGADVFAKATNGDGKYCVPKFPLEDGNIMRRFMLILWDRENMQKQMEEKMGLTRLHIACYMKNKKYVRSVLNGGNVNVNARIDEDSEIFSGCTPLHLLLKISAKVTYGLNTSKYTVPFNLNKFPVESIIGLLLAHGADVTIMDIKGNSPVHLFFKYQWHFVDCDRCEKLLIDAQRDFSINPTNDEGMSHFHLACLLHKIEDVEKFLQHRSVDVNRPIDFFAEAYPGCTPLHLVLMLPDFSPWSSVTRIVDLLLEHGANIAAKDILGDTPLHKPTPTRSSGLSMWKKLVDYGADVNMKNVQGETPLDLFFFSGRGDPYELLRIFEKHNYRINNWNYVTGEGHIAKMLASCNRKDITKCPEFKELLQSSDVKAMDEMGRTVIHNSVAIKKFQLDYPTNIISAIENFIPLGIDLDHQDEKGRTALHYATRMNNLPGVKILLKCGADINVLDNIGMSACSYVMERPDFQKSEIWSSSPESVAMYLHLHIQKLLHLGVEVNQMNRNFTDLIQQTLNRKRICLVPLHYEGFRVQERFHERSRLQKEFFSEVQKTKNLSVGVASLVLFDFLNDVSVVPLYPYLPISQRTVIDNFFNNYEENEFQELSGILKLQYRKIKTRLELIDPALSALRELLGFSFPGLCEEISKFLSNNDLKHLITSTEIGDNNLH